MLTIGLAVDTNVIIFERIKDELTKGKSYQLAVNDGYRRSLAPVIDAHVTSLLTAIILAYFGLGPVLGFATTQIIGILLSLFCGILVSRLITDFWTNKNRHFNYFTGISKKIFKNPSFKFIEFRKYAYIISAFVLLAGVAAFFNGFHLGVEFKGGRSYTIQFDRPVVNDDIRNDLKVALDGDNTTIKTVGDSRHLNITTAYLKGVDNADSAVKARLYLGLKKVLPADLTYAQFVKTSIQGYSEVQPSISDDLKRGAVKATIFAMLIIFLYIFIRFRDWRYSVGAPNRLGVNNRHFGLSFLGRQQMGFDAKGFALALQTHQIQPFFLANRDIQPAHRVIGLAVGAIGVHSQAQIGCEWLQLAIEFGAIVRHLGHQFGMA